MKVSVIITCYNLENYISRAIHSCINQTMIPNDYEIVVVDDFSSDNSWKLISSFGDFGGRIISIKHKKNMGVGYATNTAISASKGKYIIKVDGDDFINKNLLKNMSQILDNNDDIGFVYGDLIKVRGNSRKVFKINTVKRLLDHGAGIMFEGIILMQLVDTLINFKPEMITIF